MSSHRDYDRGRSRRDEEYEDRHSSRREDVRHSRHRSASRSPPRRERNDRDEGRYRDRDRDRDRDPDRSRRHNEERRDRDREEADDRFRFMNPERAKMIQRGPPPESDRTDNAPRRYGGRDDFGAGPELYSIHKGQVKTVKDFGVFVQLEGFRKQGLVHISQLSNERVEPEDIPGIVEVGDSVWVKVIGISDDEQKKISLSMKYVQQSTGEDFDPNNVKLEESQQKRKPRPDEPQKIQLGAILPTVCTKCGARGHLARECYSVGGAQYDLIPEPEGGEDLERSPSPVGEVASLKQALKILAQKNKEEKEKKKQKRKHKKEKKDKKKKDRHKKKKRRRSSDSD